MTPSTLILYARGCEADIVRLNRPTWEPFFEHIIILTPEDDPIPGGIQHGKSGHVGPEAVERMNRGLREALRHECAVLGEPDCLFFDFMDVEDGELVCSEVHPNIDPQFTAESFPHSPLLATRNTFWSIMLALEYVEEHGYGDRMIARACALAGIPLRGVGFSRNSLDTQETIQQGMQAVRNGAKCVHGCKDEMATNSLRCVGPRVTMPLGW